jgi:hypothetical protein
MMSRKPKTPQPTAFALASEDEPTLLDQIHVLKDKPGVLAFLKEHSYLLPLVTEASAILGEYFVHPTLSIEIHSDPELARSQLVLSIGTSLEIDQALRQLERFRQDWWLDQLGRTKGNLIIDVDSE